MHAARGRLLQQQDPAGDGEIVRRQAARGVRAERQRHLVPGDPDVRMMVGLLGQIGDGTDEEKSVLEVSTLDNRGDRATVPGPGRHSLQLDLDELLGESFHGYGIPLPR